MGREHGLNVPRKKRYKVAINGSNNYEHAYSPGEAVQTIGRRWLVEGAVARSKSDLVVTGVWVGDEPYKDVGTTAWTQLFPVPGQPGEWVEADSPRLAVPVDIRLESYTLMDGELDAVRFALETVRSEYQGCPPSPKYEACIALLEKLGGE